MTKVACACCGFQVLDERGGYEICPICFWEDDIVQISNPWYDGGANSPSLIEAQAAFSEIGAMETRFLEDVRPPHSSDRKDPEWRAVLASDKEYITSPREIEAKREKGIVIPYEYWRRGASK